MTYGTGTRSFNRSPEKRQLNREVKAVTEAYLARPDRLTVLFPLMCRCRSFELPHPLSEHSKLRDLWDWRTPEERKS